MVIDIHNHHWSRDSVPGKFWEGLANRVATVRTQREKISTTPEYVKHNLFKAFDDPSGDVLLKEMAEAGIDVTVLLALDLGLGMGEPALPIMEQNRMLAELCRRHPNKLISFVGIDPRREDAVELLETAVKQWGMRGVKFHPGAGWYPNNRQYYPVYEMAAELKIPALFHTGTQLPPFRSIYSQPVFLDDITVDFPELTIIAAHMGVGWWRELTSMIEKKRNLFADISGWQVYAMRNYNNFCRTFREIIDLAGADKILFGTDGPTFRLYKFTNQVWVKTIQELPQKAPAGIIFTQKEVQMILWKNAKNILEKEG